MTTQTAVLPPTRPDIRPRLSSSFRAPFRLHRLILLPILTGIVLLDIAGSNFSAERAPILSVLIVLCFGMPHGAFDVALAARSWGIDNSLHRAKFIAEYVTLAALVILFWLTFPGEALCGFLGLSALHFSEDWEIELQPVHRTFIGAAVISFPAIYHEEGVANIFTWLVPSTDASALAHGMHLVAIVIIPLAVFVVATISSNRRTGAAEIAILLALALVATPLTFFVIYFCGLHSIRHFCHVREALKSRSTSAFLWLGLPYAAAAIVGVLALSTSFQMPIEGALLKGLFVGLAALTVPHMLLASEDEAVS